MFHRFVAAAPLALFLAACGSEPGETPVEIEPVSTEVAEIEIWDKGAMVAAADRRAVEAGLKILESGGHAVDAAIAVHAVLGLVEPQSSGIGGGAFMLVYEADTSEMTVYDGRETAPAAATPDLFMEDGEVLDYISSWQSGRSAGVPGQIALYKVAHDAHGTSDWNDLFSNAISLAEDGWEVSPRLAQVLANPRLREFIRLDDHPVSSAYFFPGGEPLAAGDVVKNPDYANTLRTVSLLGPDAFYKGALAQDIVDTVNEEPRPGGMTLEDLSSYEVKVRSPICGDHADGMRICSAPPPSSGGIAQNMIVGLYQRLVETRGSDTTDAKVRDFVDAQRLAYADRDHYVADADFVPVPSDDLVNPDYLDARAGEAFTPDAASTPGDPGVVLGRQPLIDMWGRDTTDETPGTTHLSIVDANGNAVSMTATIESAFGNSRMVGGFLLNNELTDFARDPQINGKPVANAPGQGKRPRSSMSPTLVFDGEGDLFMVTGSPGGNSIVAYVSKTLVGVLDWGLTAQEAAGFPNIIARGDTIGVEIDRENGQALADMLSDEGYNVQEREGEASGLHLIVVREDGLEGGADPRREGVALTPEDVAGQ